MLSEGSVMEDFFIIPENKIDPAWNPPDRSLELFVLDYCEEVLAIPLFVIEDAFYTNEGVEVDLKNLEDWMMGEDWYINLFRLSNYAKAS
jgi:hypothetical protein